MNNASFHFPAGETTFVVGKSGSGKSTIGNLLVRFYNVGSGELLVDGHPINILDINWLRKNVTLVHQQSVLFNESVFQNIAFGHRDHSRVRKEEVKRAIETALLQHTVSDLPQGLDTLVGIGGSALSGGQKQRIAIARARLRDTPILVLDEATCALDHISKNMIVDEIRRWRQGKTTIIITHDMSQVQDGDYAYVLDSGVVVQEGFKDTLKKSDFGPFQQRDVPIPGFSFTQPCPVMSQVLPSSSCPARGPPPTTMKSEISPVPRDQGKKRVILDMLGPQSDDVKRPSQAYISLISPTSVYRSSAASSNTQLHQHEIPKYSDISEPFSPLWPHDVKAIKMSETISSVNIKGYAIQQELAPYASVASPRKPRGKQNLTKADKVRRVAPMKKILMTVWPALANGKRMVLVLGFLCAAIHAAAIPAFSWVFSQLLATFYLPDAHERSCMAMVIDCIWGSGR